MRHIAAIILILLLASGCGPVTNTRPDSSGSSGGGNLRAATRLLAQGKYIAAAEVYLRAAEGRRVTARGCQVIIEQ